MRSAIRSPELGAQPYATEAHEPVGPDEGDAIFRWSIYWHTVRLGLCKHSPPKKRVEEANAEQLNIWHRHTHTHTHESVNGILFPFT